MDENTSEAVAATRENGPVLMPEEWQTYVRAEFRELHGVLASIRGGIASVNSRLETIHTDQKELRAYVESLDEEARKTMEGMMDPSKMMEQFMGGGK